MKNKIIFIIATICFLLNTNYAQASWSYGSKFLATTFAGCAVGGAGSYIYADNTGYDSQPKLIVTWMGAATGCLTGALFSYFFYDDESAALSQVNEQLMATNNALQRQLQKSVNTSTFGPPLPSIDLSGVSSHLILNSMQIGKLSSLSEIDVKTNPTINDCESGVYSLWMDSNGFVHSANKEERPRNLWIPVSSDLAISAWQFLYSDKNCFKAHPQYGYFESIAPGLTKMLKNQITMTAEKSVNNKTKSAQN
jgi:hypothetical protein